MTAMKETKRQKYCTNYRSIIKNKAYEKYFIIHKSYTIIWKEKKQVQDKSQNVHVDLIVMLVGRRICWRQWLLGISFWNTILT